MKASKAGRLEHEDHKADDAPSGADDARADRETDLALVPVMGRLLGQGLKAVSLEARRDPAVPELERILSRVRPDEGLERIIHELRRSSVFAPIEGGLAIEVVPTLNPAATSLPWMDRMDEGHLQRMRRWAAQDPSRILETRLPVGLAFDMMDMVPDEDFLRDSEVYTGVYDTFVDSWGAVVLHRDARATWLLTGWHRIEGLERRLKLRTSLQRLSPSLSAAFGRVGLFGTSETDPPARRNYVKGWTRPECHLQRDLAEIDPGDQIAYGTTPASGKIETQTTPTTLTEPHSLSLSEWSDEALAAQAEILRGLIGRHRETLRRIEQEQKARLEFAEAVLVSTFNARAVSLVERFEADPRPVVIVVSGTDRSCILKPANPDDLPEESVPISQLGQHGSGLVHEVSDPGAHGRTRIGIRRGRGRTLRIVAELCPPNSRSRAYIDVLKRVGEAV